MHVIVVGAGAAGLAAAWRLREAGVEVTLVEMADHVGGRCHAVHWHGDWRITGAFAFTTVEENLIEQARKLGIYDPAELLDLSGAHTHDILMHGDRVISLKDFEPSTILGCGAVPWREKLALAKALPRLAKQMLTSDWRDPTPTSVYDTETAEAYFRPGAPVFIDYLLEPIMQHFNGFAHDDLSIAWLLWILGGRPWSRSWWSFQERGVGRLTHAMGERLVEDGMRLLLNARVGRVGHAADGVEVDARIEGAPQTLTGDAVVCAVPGSLVNQLVPDLAEDYRAFFSSVQYGALYLSYYLVELPAELSPAELPEALILPTVDGFHNAAYFYVQPLASRQAIVHVEMKGAASAAARDQSEEQVRTALWTDVVTAAPRMAQCRIEDFLLIRNDLAIMKPYVGYIEALRRFRALPPLQNIAFAGDYLLTSTVGQAHYSGLQAAESLLR